MSRNLKVNMQNIELELELELIQTQMAQKPMLRAEVYAHAMRASKNRKKEVRREKEVLYFQPSQTIEAPQGRSKNSTGLFAVMKKRALTIAT